MRHVPLAKRPDTTQFIFFFYIRKNDGVIDKAAIIVKINLMPRFGKLGKFYF